jgi:Fungal Zn(2)-Cys(6) binuclear cluster domain
MTGRQVGSQHLSKRFACDRCRELKLRCPREVHSNEPCARCVRADALCITSGARPVGCSAQVGVNNIQRESGHKRRRKDEGTILPASSHAPFEESTERYSLPTPAPEVQPGIDSLSTGPVLTPWIAESVREAGSPIQSLQEDVNITDLFHFVPDFMPVSSRSTEYLGSAVLPHRIPDLPPSPTSPPASLLTSESQSTVQGKLKTPTAQESPMSEDSMAYLRVYQEAKAPPKDYSDLVLRLSSLNVDLSKQLATVTSESWEGTLVNMTYSACINITNMATDSSPLGNILQSTSEFVRILQALVLPCATSTASQNDDINITDNSQAPAIVPSLVRPRSMLSATRSQPSDLPHQFNISTMLVIVACYLQIVRIYDVIFTRVYSCLCECMPQQFASSSQETLGLQLEGFPVHHRSLQVKILKQVTEHLLDHIERLMSMPTEYRLSASHTKLYNGILSSMESTALLREIMRQKDGDGTNNVWAGYIQSLKEKMRQIEGLLESAVFWLR